MNEAAFPPKLYMIGAQKAGTTTLAHLLNQHPDVSLSDPKETDFYTVEGAKTLDWYRKCYPKNLTPVLLDASPSYTMVPLYKGPDDSIPQRMKAQVPDAKFIYLLRDPVDRVVSAYWHDRRAQITSKTLRDQLEESRFYIEVSRYYGQLEMYLRHFPIERFLFIDFKELEADPAAVTRRCLEFAGVDPGKTEIDAGEPLNQGFLYNGIGKVFFNLFPNPQAAANFINAVKSVTPAFVHRLAKSALTTDTGSISDADREWLQDIFREENQKMEALAGFRFYR